MNVLITGGTGFIGSYIAEELFNNGFKIRILHRADIIKKNPHFEYYKGNLVNKDSLVNALEGIDIISHQAALGGFGSTYSDYLQVNCLGISNIMDIIKKNDLSIKRIVFASTQSVYGEGSYYCNKHKEVSVGTRPLNQLESKSWELNCHMCSKILMPIATSESKSSDTMQMYAISKYAGERILTSACNELGIDLSILRYSLVFGAREAAFRILSLFSKKIFNGESILLHEDGKQLRDFIYVGDVAEANLFVISNNISGVFNLGTGEPTSLREFIELLSKIYNIKAKLKIEGTFRIGDTRHLFSDIGKLKQVGYSPRTSLQSGINKYYDWIKTEMGGCREYFMKDSL